MPKALLDFIGYSFFFWSNENNEPPHIHVCKGKPRENATKFWIRDDEVVMEHNKSNIPANDLRKIQMYLSLNKKDIIYEWYRHFK
ncbi:MAG: DUF4160 domain-containing protein [Lachnospiraceae bacterium]|nr:DUF4160 domain-containing protein [Lachnospiraceae bacterium]